MTSLNDRLSTEPYPWPRMVFSTAVKPKSVIALRRIAEVTRQEGPMIFRVAACGHSFEIFVRDSAVDDDKIL